MHFYVLVPLLACIVSATIALQVWVRDPSHRPTRPIVGVSAAAAFWALCEVVWNLAATRETALLWIRLSAPGWVALGPLALGAVCAAVEMRSPRMERALAGLYAAAGVGLVIAWSTPWMVADAVRTSWGWSAVPGPALPFQYMLTAAAVTAGLVVWQRAVRSNAKQEGRTRSRFVTGALVVPLAVASTTDVVLPLLGHFDVPRLGTASLAFLGVLHIVSYYRYGDSALVPEGFTARILDTVPDGIAALSPSGRVRAVNDRLSDLIGLPRNQITGRSIGDYLKSEPLFAPFREVRDLECELTPVVGTPIAASVSTILQTDNLGMPRGVVLVVRDLREVVALRNNLLTSGRLAAVGELAAGIAHEINNPVTYVRANLSVLREHWRTLGKALERDARPELLELLAEGEELIDESLEGVDRASAIVRDVREFSHAGGTGAEPADVNQLLEQTLRVASPQIPRGARIERYFGDIPPVECEPQRIKQVLLNLVLNAAQAIGPDGTIRIRSWLQGPTVIVSVEDDGSGIAPDVIDRIFDPFFTTKPVGVGTGLGLPIAFGIVRQHGGRIEVESTPGRGSVFRAHLPAERPGAAEPGAAPSAS
jgi:signal transduction histidine kinase